MGKTNSITRQTLLGPTHPSTKYRVLSLIKSDTEAVYGTHLESPAGPSGNTDPSLDVESPPLLCAASVARSWAPRSSPWGLSTNKGPLGAGHLYMCTRHAAGTWMSRDGGFLQRRRPGASTPRQREAPGSVSRGCSQALGREGPGGEAADPVPARPWSQASARQQDQNPPSPHSGPTLPPCSGHSGRPESSGTAHRTPGGQAHSEIQGSLAGHGGLGPREPSSLGGPTGNDLKAQHKVTERKKWDGGDGGSAGAPARSAAFCRRGTGRVQGPSSSLVALAARLCWRWSLKGRAETEEPSVSGERAGRPQDLPQPQPEDSGFPRAAGRPSGGGAHCQATRERAGAARAAAGLIYSRLSAQRAPAPGEVRAPVLIKGQRDEGGR